MNKIIFCIVFALFGATGYAQTVPPKEKPPSATEKTIVYPQPANLDDKKTKQPIPTKIQQIRDIRRAWREQMDSIRNNVA